MRPIAAALLALTLAGCVAPPPPDTRLSEVTLADCDAVGLRAVAMEDGMNGLGPDAETARLAACRTLGAAPDQAVYANAYDEGASRYCTGENAWRLGRGGHEVLRECPAEDRAAFDRAYRNGLDAREVVALVPHIAVGAGAGPRGVRPKLGFGLDLIF